MAREAAITAAQLAHLAAQGYDRAEAARASGAGYEAIRSACRRHGIRLPSPAEKAAAAAVRLHREALTRAEIAKRIGKDERSVYRYLRAVGLTDQYRRTLAPEQEQAVAAAYQAGEQAISIAARYSVSDHLVYATLRRTGFAPRVPGGLAKGIDRERVIALWTEHQHTGEVAERLDVSISTVRYHLHAAGIELPPPNGRTYVNTRYPQVVTLIKAGSSRKEAAERLGITLHTVDYHVRRARQRGDLPPVPAS